MFKGGLTAATAMKATRQSAASVLALTTDDPLEAAELKRAIGE